MKSGTTLITEKREKHVKKGYNYEHDTEHTPQQFVNAAVAYALNDPYKWPFDRQSLILRGDLLDNLINAGSMIAAAIDRLQRYEVDKVYQLNTGIGNGTVIGIFKVLKIQMLKSGTVLIHFIGLSGDLRPDKQKFMLGSPFDKNSNPIEK